MKDTLVIDASVAAQWLLPEANTPEALQVLSVVPRLIALELIYSEVANTLWKRMRRGEITRQQGEQLLSTFFSIRLEIHPTIALFPAAWQVAADLGITVYDALYVALAELLHAPLLTADRRLHNQANALSLRIQVVWIADIPIWLTGAN